MGAVVQWAGDHCQFGQFIGAVCARVVPNLCAPGNALMTRDQVEAYLHQAVDNGSITADEVVNLERELKENIIFPTVIDLLDHVRAFSLDEDVKPDGFEFRVCKRKHCGLQSPHGDIVSSDERHTVDKVLDLVDAFNLVALLVGQKRLQPAQAVRLYQTIAAAGVPCTPEEQAEQQMATMDIVVQDIKPATVFIPGVGTVPALIVAADLSSLQSGGAGDDPAPDEGKQDDQAGEGDDDLT